MVLMSSLKTVQIIVGGKVQGVFFRANTKSVADSLSLVGYVRNLSNGNVEIVAQGDSKAIDNLIDWVRKGGPPSAVVRSVNVKELKLSEKYSSFTIAPDG